MPTTAVRSFATFSKGSIAFSFSTASTSSSNSSSPFSSSKRNLSSSPFLRLRLTPTPTLASSSRILWPRDRPFILHSTGDGGCDGSFGGGGHGGGDHNEDGNARDESRKREALLVLAEAGKSLESVPTDLAATIKEGKIPASVVS